MLVMHDLFLTLSFQGERRDSGGIVLFVSQVEFFEVVFQRTIDGE